MAILLGLLLVGRYLIMLKKSDQLMVAPPARSFDEFDKMLVRAGFLHIKKYPAFDPSKEAAEDTPIIIYECVK